MKYASLGSISSGTEDLLEFHIDLGDDADRFNRLDSFTRGYVEAMFFTEDTEGHLGSFADVSQTMLVEVVADCQRFQEENAKLLQRAYARWTECGEKPYDAERAGNDFWYTRNHHGVGFWDRDLGKVGDELTTAAHAYIEKGLYCGDDDLLYLA